MSRLTRFPNINQVLIELCFYSKRLYSEAFHLKMHYIRWILCVCGNSYNKIVRFWKKNAKIDVLNLKKTWVTALCQQKKHLLNYKMSVDAVVSFKDLCFIWRIKSEWFFFKKQISEGTLYCVHYVMNRITWRKNNWLKNIYCDIIWKYLLYSFHNQI